MASSTSGRGDSRHAGAVLHQPHACLRLSIHYIATTLQPPSNPFRRARARWRGRVDACAFDDTIMTSPCSTTHSPNHDELKNKCFAVNTLWVFSVESNYCLWARVSFCCLWRCLFSGETIDEWTGMLFIELRAASLSRKTKTCTK